MYYTEEELASYSLEDLYDEKESIKSLMRRCELGDDYYYSSGRYGKDESRLHEIEVEIEKRENVK